LLQAKVVFFIPKVIRRAISNKQAAPYRMRHVNRNRLPGVKTFQILWLTTRLTSGAIPG
jgi:hypothetical protein